MLKDKQKKTLRENNEEELARTQQQLDSCAGTIKRCAPAACFCAYVVQAPVGCARVSCSSCRFGIRSPS